MAFKKLSSRRARRWSIIGFPGDGKSSLAAQMQAPLLPIDIDGRFSEVAHLANGEVLALSDDRADNNDVQAIDRLLKENMPDSGVKTIIVDSVTPLFQRITRRHQVNEHEGTTEGNKSAVHREKADVMALLGTCVSSYGTDTLWIWHLAESSFNGQKNIKQSLSATEVERLRKYLNAELMVVIDKDGKHGIQINWSRSGFGTGEVVWDTQENFDSGNFWKGIPEKLDDILAGVVANPATTTAQNAQPNPIPATTSGSPEVRSFVSMETAIEWGATELLVTKEAATEIYTSVKAK